MTAPTNAPKASARVYYPLFDGIDPEGQDQRIRALDMALEIGGEKADLATNYQVSIYGRRVVDEPNLITIFRKVVERAAGQPWVPVPVSRQITHPNVHCIVLKLEAMETDFTPPADPTATHTYDDQASTADPPPWGVRIKEGGSAVYASDLVRDVTVRHVIEDIVSPYFTVTGANSTLQLDQLAFSDIPKSRAEALDDVNAMMGYCYSCWEDGELHLQAPDTGTRRVADVTDPCISFSPITENIDDTFNAVRVLYKNKYGRARDVIEHRDSRAITAVDPDLVKADTIDAPDSVQSEKAARKVGQRYLRDHNPASVSGSLHVEGESESFGDALLVRPGDRVTIAGAGDVRHDLPVTAVTLHPLTWEADVQFDVAPAKFARWLKKLEAGAHARKR